MLEEAAQLEELRQKIEDAEYEAGNQSDDLSYGKPNEAQAKRAQALIAKLNTERKASKEELNKLLGALRSQKPQAVDERVNFHAGILQMIIDETATGANAKTRQRVAKETLQAWEKVRAGEQEYVRINWHYLKDYKAGVRKSGSNFGNNTAPGGRRQTRNDKSKTNQLPATRETGLVDIGLR